MPGSKKPSVRKISEITGFSPATVSNALNGKRGVNKETAEHIPSGGPGDGLHHEPSEIEEH